MKIAHLLNLNFSNRLILLIVPLLFVIGCGQGSISPEVKLSLIVLLAIISFIAIFTKPIIGIYAVAIISTTFSPTVNIGFANLYFHQWVILIALLASISSGLILENFHTKVKYGLNIPMIIFVGSLLLSMAHAPHMVTGIKSFLYIGVLIASFYLVLLCVNSVQHIKVFIALLVIATSIVCMISLKYHTSGRLGSLVLRNPNSFANFLALVIPFSTSVFLYGSLEKGKRLILGLSLFLMFVSLALTFSRSAWVGVFVGFISLFVLRPRGSLVFLICGIISAILLLSPIQKRVFKDISDPGVQYRIVKAKIAYDNFKKKPLLGNGLGSFHYGAQFSEVWAYRAHSTLENNYLLMLAEGGIIEFLAFLCLIIAFGKKAIAFLKRVRDPFIYSVLLGSLMGIVSTLAAGMFEDTLFFPKNNWLIGMFMGIVIVVGRMNEEYLVMENELEVEAPGGEGRPLQMNTA